MADSFVPFPRRRTVLAASAALIGATLAGSAAPVAAQARDEVARKVDALLAKMTLEEKVGQLTQLGNGIPGPNKETTDELIRAGKAGSVLWTVNSDDIARMQRVAVKESRLGIPLLFGFDVIHGYKNVFPVPLAMAASWDPALVEKAQAIAARESRVAGINWTFAPMVDIARDARWGRIVEGAGEDPVLGAAMARAQVRGFQGVQPGGADRVLTSVKHFAGYGAADGGRDYDSSYVPEVLMQNLYFPPFQAAVSAGAGTVMSAYMTLNDVPASGNRWLLRDVLRQQMGFKGFVISDAFAVESLIKHGYAADTSDAAARGLTAGVNMDMASNTYMKALPALVKQGKVPMRVVDDAVREVLGVKFRMGLFEQPYGGDAAQRDAVWNDRAARAATREAAQRSIVLLRNEAKALPLAAGVKRIAVIGPLADAAEDIKGSWTVEGSAKAVSVLEGIRARWPQAEVTHAAGGDMQRLYPLPWDAAEGKPAPKRMTDAEMQAEQARAVSVAQQADTVVLVLGERANMSGEAASTASLALQGNQQALLEAVVATGKPVVLVLLSGRPLDISWAATRVPAIVQAWFPGTEGGHAVADVLSGAVNPGGKLPVTWPRSTGHVPAFYNHNLTHDNDTGPHFTSRYATSATSTPLYPFGHGLSYTSFAYADLKLDRTTAKAGDPVRVTVTVRNTGAVAGDEVVQLYVHQRAGSAARPQRELKGFQRVSLAPGAQQQVSFTLGRDELKFWSPVTRAFGVEPSGFDVWVGGDSTATLHAEFTLTR
ncbi:beta-glucosidase BglX [Pelomonas cellulosilytica]|uniref:Beta-glucosidase BglX n=1 Tax=Pelomonas cellulosilytica TaxID=2906762 RepID=A0ABS8XS48_9BURK|nr:beta-glucosidase BglX [Pelomonas sp. P8]MCE4553666.1 beta-glucosidase BglX [Pelomonas sp. P8]